ncbi:OYE2-NADPH dehydrogenase (old yellow enzyme) isoform 1 [Fusarium subglutinans]|uniref:OYE2-NADPH dehydrogenase (Old yellow enzyme) isoform 1 n=1 Tax=Gibberella subglutinans TaxID=42677 RepID=A0A8H5Q4B0_GIBSU|nr:OYE2-NADPH dehydrogenase (old yellow enzyme) isoform 1 [Fusarium subglutinans]KAF5608412.1 OYE2-NADPH dehydrogenase (old yellow enzyme) isoform 1 [Fusarium subglutinans]
MGDIIDTGASSKLFTPLDIGNGKVHLKHRIIHAPLTRNRGTPFNPESTLEKPNRLWVPNDLMTEYYSQRATNGGLIISEGLPPSLEGNGMPGVPGIFLPEQVEGWKKVVSAVHSKGGYIYAQLWHSGRANIPQLTGTPILAPSATPWDDPNETFAYLPPHSTTPVKIADYPPIEMTVDKIKSTIRDYVNAAKNAIEAGFDGVEVHGGNGYLVEQFLSSNINRRTDNYGGSEEKRCNFALELMEELAKAIGQENLAIRLTPFGLFNQARGEKRVETWSHLCRELKSRLPKLSYVSFVEPRYEQIFSEAEKQKFLGSWGLPTADLSLFRSIFGDTPFFSAGGFNDVNSWGVVESGKYDGLLYGRYFISNPDLVERLRNGWQLQAYDRKTFYGPFENNAVGYTDYPFYKKE